jgi:hypothetical protein
MLRIPRVPHRLHIARVWDTILYTGRNRLHRCRTLGTVLDMPNHVRGSEAYFNRSPAAVDSACGPQVFMSLNAFSPFISLCSYYSARLYARSAYLGFSWCRLPSTLLFSAAAVDAQRPSYLAALQHYQYVTLLLERLRRLHGSRCDCNTSFPQIPHMIRIRLIGCLTQRALYT